MMKVTSFDAEGNVLREFTIDDFADEHMAALLYRTDWTVDNVVVNLTNGRAAMYEKFPGYPLQSHRASDRVTPIPSA